MKIKEITIFSDDVFNAVLRLLPQLDPGSDLPTKEHFKNILKSQHIHFFVLEQDNVIIGMLSLVTYDIPTGKKVWIEDVVVDKSHRGKGLGKKMILFAIDFSKTEGAKSIELTSRPSRVEANHLYQKLGFVLRETNMYMFTF
jgi:ribosomal protein S18 acetylase RimI-like enzyme